MRALAGNLKLFAGAFAALLMAPAYLVWAPPFMPLLRFGDVLDLFTPFVLIPLYWRLIRSAHAGPLERREMVAFCGLSIAWILGHGMHLTANSIGHHMDAIEGSDAQLLTYFYDEQLAHHLWHGAIIGFLALLLRRSREIVGGRVPWELAPFALLHGFAYFAVTTEGQSTHLSVPAALIMLVWMALRRRDSLRAHPALFFVMISLVSSLTLFGIWAGLQGGLPEFSAVGWLD